MIKELASGTTNDPNTAFPLDAPLEKLICPGLQIGQRKVLMVTHPRSCATAIELYLEQCGFRVECNVFDRDYYCLQQAGQCHPRDMHVTERDRFNAVAGRLQDEEGPLLVRAAGYTFAPHFSSEALVPLMRSFDERLILVRSPAYALASHRAITERLGEALSLEEAGYVPQLRLALWMERQGLPFRVLDAHEVLTHPKSTLSFLGLDRMQGEVYWETGMRERWGLWPDWKEDAATSTHLRPFRQKPEQAEIGRHDPFYPECEAAYRALLQLGRTENFGDRQVQ